MILLEIPISAFQRPIQVMIPINLYNNYECLDGCDSIIEITLFVQCDPLQILSIVNNNIIFEQFI